MVMVLGRPRVQPFVRTKSITANYTVTLADAGWLILIDTTSASITVSLPALATAGDGFVVTLKRITAGANTVTIDPSGAETVEGSATLSMPTQYTSMVLVSQSTGWFIGVAPIPLGRTITAGTGLTGGGTLAGDITLAVSGGGQPTIQVFTADGTWNRPSGCTAIIVFGTGGGGGGGGADNNAAGGGGGGAGGTAIVRLDVSALASAAVVIGVGGTAGSNTGGNGGSGGTTTFNGTSLSAAGGSGGRGVAGAGDSGRGGAGGVPTVGDMLITGGEGGPGIGSGSVGTISAGTGGASYWGGGGSGAATNTPGSGASGSAYGSGGGGGASNSTTGRTGGAGKDGVVFVVEYY